MQKYTTKGKNKEKNNNPKLKRMSRVIMILRYPKPVDSKSNPATKNYVVQKCY
jgi:hypothetical protein